MINAIRKGKNQSGYTMLELLLVLGIIIALAAIMIYAFLSRANKQSSINTAAAQVSNIVTAERNGIQRQGNVLTLPADAEKMANYGLQQQIVQNSAHANPWGGAYTITDASNGQFQVAITDVPSNITTGPDYQTFVQELSRLGEGAGIAPQGKGAKSECTATGNEIDCTFDNQ